MSVATAAPKACLVANYRVDFLGHDGELFDTLEFERESDDAAIQHAHDINVPGVSGGFEVWERNRLVHRHRNWR
jgi:hypothetical protein